MHSEIFEKMTQLQLMLHRHQIRKVAAGGPLADTSRGQGRILALLRMQDGVSAKDLAYLLGIRVSSLNELLAKLEKNGYILREQSESDGRVSLVKLTNKGHAEQCDASGDELLNALSPSEQEAFSDYLDRIIAALDKEDGAFPDFVPPFPILPFPAPMGGTFGMAPPPSPFLEQPPVELAENCPCKFEDCDTYRNCRACKQKHHFSGTQTSCGK